ncbi:MAG: ElyC/SanA/YdcF family protein [Patescibacteria group bacterium]
MSKIYICVGCGLHKDGEISRMNKKMVDLAMEQGFYNGLMKSWNIIFQGGYKNASGMTEAESMILYAQNSNLFPDFENRILLEKESYRTHNNALEGLRIVSERFPRNYAITIIGHPQHIERALLCYRMASKLFYGNRYKIYAMSAEETYDPLIPGQEYWADKQLFTTREKKIMKLYKFLLFKSWARLGFFLLRMIWPNKKQ